MRVALIFVMTVLGLCATAGAVRAADRPNVLLICVDDLKPLLGCYGNQIVKSPNIDRLAARGVRFERAYCNQAVCAPSRNALLTGLRPQSLGIYDLATNFRAAAPDIVTLPQHFKAHGYRTEALGKIFHTGHGNYDDRRSWSVPHWNAKVVGYALAESRAPKGLTREEALFSNVPAERASRLPRGAAFESADVPDSAYADGRLADEAIRRLTLAAKTPGEPFFLAVGFVKPHLPFCAPKKYWDLYDPSAFVLPERRTPPEGAPRFAPTTWGELRQYSSIPETGDLPDELQRTLIHGYHAAVSYMDAQLGRVIDALDETGLAKNTVIVLWGDHGWHLGDHGMWCKHSNYEQATRIPVIVVAPSGNGSGVSHALIESVDIYPTLCELAGIDAPERLDGTSFAAALNDPSSLTKRAVMHVYPRNRRLGRAVRTARYRLVEWKRPGAAADTAVLELYDYETDPDETKNLAGDKPEVVAELREILAAQPEAKPQLRARGSNRRAGGRTRRNASRVQSLISSGAYSQVERILRRQIPDPSAPVTSDAAIQLEILRRTRYDFALTPKQALEQIRERIPDATGEDMDRWRQAGDLEYREIDGETRYFRRSVSNLFRFNEEAKRRQVNAAAEKKFDTTAHVEELVRIADSTEDRLIYPVHHRVRYELSVKKGHPRLQPGAKVRAWLPFPQEYRQQRDVKMISCDPPGGLVADNGSAHRTIYFERPINGPHDAPRFRVDFELVTSAYYPQLDAAKVQPYDVGAELYRDYTAERAPHIVFTPEVRKLATEIIGDETNPLEKALRIFRWVSRNIPWCAEKEYSTIANLSAKGLTARRGDCGVQGMSFITLCRAAGVPARWQSGWQTKPGEWNMHDWSEFYVEPWGWLPADASYGLRDHPDPRVRDFFCGHMDPYRLIVNLDYGRPLVPAKTSFRSEPNDFQRGEIEIDGHNLYFDEWDWAFRVETTPLSRAAADAAGR